MKKEEPLNSSRAHAIIKQMYYRLKSDVALRKWKYVDRAIYVKGINHALSVSEEDFELLLLCDGNHDLEDNTRINNLINKGYIEKCQKGDKPNEWSIFKEYDNYYFPMMNLMITGKCNLNCLHCFNAKDNAPLNTEWKYDDLIHLLDEARDVGVHALTITGGEPLFHPRFMDIIKAIYQRDMFVFELNTNGFLITQKLLDELKEIGCRPLMKISFDGIDFHNWIRQNPKAEDITLRAIKLCVKNGFQVKVQMQVHHKNVDVMLDTLKMLDELGVHTTRIIRTTEAPRWEKNSPQTSLRVPEYYEKMLLLAKDIQESSIKMNVDIWQFMTIFPIAKRYSLSPILCNEKEFNIRIPMCKGVRGMIAISSSGEVVPCLQMSGWMSERNISLANVHKTSLKDILTDSEYLNYATATLFKQIIENDKCSSCKYYKACTGGCPALGLLYSKEDKFDYYHEDITKCYFFENGWYERIVKEMDKYSIENPLEISE